MNKEGFLTKRGHFRKNFLRRFFRLSGSQIEYFKSESGAKRGTIGLVPTSTVAILPMSAPSDKRKSFADDGQCYFEIANTAGGRSYLLRADSEEEGQDWIQAVSQNIASLQGRRQASW